MLFVVGTDGNNQMYLIAWAIVESENKESWGWFIQLLVGDLEDNDGVRWTIINDQQKVINYKSFYFFLKHEF